MAGREFSEIVAGGLLRDVELIVVESHGRLWRARGWDWAPPVAYRWLRYEDPAPVLRLAEGVRKLRRMGADFDPRAVEKTCEKAARGGFLN
jgi:hypothetical protein